MQTIMRDAFIHVGYWTHPDRRIDGILRALIDRCVECAAIRSQAHTV